MGYVHQSRTPNGPESQPEKYYREIVRMRKREPSVCVCVVNRRMTDVQYKASDYGWWMDRVPLQNRLTWHLQQNSYDFSVRLVCILCCRAALFLLCRSFRPICLSNSIRIQFQVVRLCRSCFFGVYVCSLVDKLNFHGFIFYTQSHNAHDDRFKTFPSIVFRAMCIWRNSSRTHVLLFLSSCSLLHCVSDGVLVFLVKWQNCMRTMQ